MIERDGEHALVPVMDQRERRPLEPEPLDEREQRLVDDRAEDPVEVKRRERGDVGEALELARMKPGAILLNPSRAELVDEDALYDALATRRLAGAALDVWYRYPAAAGVSMPARRPFHELPNVLMTPHVSGWTEGMLRARATLIAENVTRVARGAPPVNLIA